VPSDEQRTGDETTEAAETPGIGGWSLKSSFTTGSSAAGFSGTETLEAGASAASLIGVEVAADGAWARPNAPERARATAKTRDLIFPSANYRQNVLDLDKSSTLDIPIFLRVSAFSKV
jgi:hypothetical protein